MSFFEMGATGHWRNRPHADLNRAWRILDDGNGWILQNKQGKSWHSMSVSTNRADLLKRCDEFDVLLDNDVIDGLPDQYKPGRL